MYRQLRLGWHHACIAHKNDPFYLRACSTWRILVKACFFDFIPVLALSAVQCLVCGLCEYPLTQGANTRMAIGTDDGWPCAWERRGRGPASAPYTMVSLLEGGR